MTTAEAAHKLEDLARELDLLVYRLELAERTEAPAASLQQTRRELERMREAIDDLARALG